MSLDLVRIAAEFRKHQRSFGIGFEVELFEVDVFALHVAFFFVEPTACSIKYASRIKRFQTNKIFICIKLPPTFVEYRVIANAGMIIEQGNGCGAVALKDFAAARGCLVRNAALDACRRYL